MLSLVCELAEASEANKQISNAKSNVDNWLARGTLMFKTYTNGSQAEGSAQEIFLFSGCHKSVQFNGRRTYSHLNMTRDTSYSIILHT